MNELIPTRLREFAGSTTLTPEDDAQILEVRLKCPRCAGDRFVLHMIYEKSQIPPHKILPFDPVWAVCDHCQYYGLLFNGRSDGANGFFNPGPVEIPTTPVQAWKEAKEPAYKIIVSPVFDENSVDQTGRIQPDVYTGLGIDVEWSDGTRQEVINFETA